MKESFVTIRAGQKRDFKAKNGRVRPLYAVLQGISAGFSLRKKVSPPCFGKNRRFEESAGFFIVGAVAF